MKSLVWLRKDLRIEDNPALFHAAAAMPDDGVIALYTISPELWTTHHDAKLKIEFQLRNLISLQASLEALNIPLIIATINGKTLLPGLKTILSEYKITDVFINSQCEWDEKKIDGVLEKYCLDHDVLFHPFSNDTLTNMDNIVKKDNAPYVVFTPFKKKCYGYLAENPIQVLPKPKKQKKQPIKSKGISIAKKYFKASFDKEKWPIGRQAALKRLDTFHEIHLKGYKNNRDIPSIHGTSYLSPYIACGVLSIRECYLTIKSTSIDSQTWVDELLWRDFYRYIAHHFNRINLSQPFRQDTTKLKWNNDISSFKKWCKGETGIPIIDAAMRQLNTHGWMHNRLRMVVASFLTKNLFIDWRWGEQYFMSKLIDGDFCSNNGGWQWAASTGNDAAPYFRVFNPYRQSERFDKDGIFIKQYCPELSHLHAKDIHCPPKLYGYPEPIVDVGLSRKLAIDAFKRIKG